MKYAEEKQVKRKSRTSKRLRARQIWYRKIYLRIFAVLIIAGIILNIAVPDRTFSERENRTLAQKPKVSAGTISDGSLFSGIDSYLSDQFAGRDLCISLRTKLLRMSGRQEVNDVIFGKDHYLFAKPTALNAEAVNQGTEAITSFAQQNENVTVYFMLVPTAAAVMTQNLPANAEVQDQLAQINAIEDAVGANVTVLDAAGVLSAHSGEYVYYKTDHHWTSYGASRVFEELAGNMGIEEHPGTYDTYTVSKSFRGTLSSQSGSRESKDTVEIYVPTGVMNEFYVYYPDSQKKTLSLYDVSKLEEKDQYTVFTGGNHALIQINTMSNSGRNLLILKDSYANSFLPFLTPYFRTIDVVDPRYYYDNLATLMTEDSITDVLILYSMNQFADDTSLKDVLNSAFHID